MIRVMMAGGWHVHAKSYAEQLAANPRSEIVAVWDDDKARGEEWAKELGCPFFEDYEKALALPGLDAVCVNAMTSAHARVIIKAAQAGKAVFTEKVLSFSTAEANEIMKAVKENGTRFCISFPMRTSPAVRAVKGMIDNGSLGDITYARMRNVHNGAIADWLPPHFYDAAQCGGGAMMDLGAHPMYTLGWLLGAPETVQSAFTYVTHHAVEDNAVSLLTYQNGAVGVSETGFVSVYNPFTLEVSGTKGCAFLRGDSATYANDDTKGEWTNLPLPEKEDSPLAQWVEAVDEKKPVPEKFGIESAVLLTRLMEAAYNSHRSGKAAQLPR